MIRRMTSDDIPAAMRLKEAAGWNQTEQDWANVLALEPEGCWVDERDGRVAGSATAVCFGKELAWIGMVLVLPEFRRRGIARALMEHALRYLEERRIACIKLDATDMGRPLYAQLGFEDETPIERWGLVPPEETLAPPGEPLDDPSGIAELDRRAFGADRLSLLRLLGEAFPGQAWSAPGAFLMGRPGSNAYFLGPCVAEDAAVARRLVEGLLGEHAGRPVFWDLLPENGEAGALARALGFEKKRSLVRMALGTNCCEELNLRSSLGLQFATAGFEYG
jgi:GNAT superfamily N-acetyltransferase